MCYQGCCYENYHGQCRATMAQMGKHPAFCCDPDEGEEVEEEE